MKLTVGQLKSLVVEARDRGERRKLDELMKRFWASRAASMVGGPKTFTFGAGDEDNVLYDTPDPDDLDLAPHLRDDDDGRDPDDFYGPVPPSKENEPGFVIDPYVKDFFLPPRGTF